MKTGIGLQMIRKEFETVLQNELMIESAPSLAGISDSLFSHPGEAIYYGTGLSTPKALSIGLPFDALAMVLTAEKLRRRLGLSKIYHHIADSHALSNPFADPQMVDALARTIEHTMSEVARHLKLEQLVVIRSSSFDRSVEYGALLNGINTDKHEYVRRELADILWYKQNKRLALKIGWIIQSGQISEGFDERLYDNEFRRLFGDTLSFVYLKAGRTFDRTRPKASPYISIPGEQRILLAPGEQVQEKIEKALAIWPDKVLGGALNHLKAIVRLYDQVAETPAEAGPISDRVQCIINRIFG
jgi:hypothetical protein